MILCSSNFSFLFFNFIASNDDDYSFVETLDWRSWLRKGSIVIARSYDPKFSEWKCSSFGQASLNATMRQSINQSPLFLGQKLTLRFKKSIHRGIRDCSSSRDERHDSRRFENLRYKASIPKFHD